MLPHGNPYRNIMIASSMHTTLEHGDEACFYMPNLMAVLQGVAEVEHSELCDRSSNVEEREIDKKS